MAQRALLRARAPRHGLLERADRVGRGRRDAPTRRQRDRRGDRRRGRALRRRADDDGRRRRRVRAARVRRGRSRGRPERQRPRAGCGDGSTPIARAVSRAIAPGGILSATVPGAVHAWETLSQRFGALPLATLLATRDPRRGGRLPGDRDSSRTPGSCSSASARCATTPRARAGSRPAAHRARASGSARRASRARCARSPRAAPPRSTKATPRSAIVAASREAGRLLRDGRPRATHLDVGRADRDDVSRRRGAGAPAERPGPRRAAGARTILECFEPAPSTSALDWHRRIEAIKVAFADRAAYIADPEHAARSRRGAARQGLRAAPRRPDRRARARWRRSGTRERHDLPLRRRRARQSRLVHPEPLHRLRLRHRLRRHGHRAAEPRRGLRARPRSPELPRAEQASVPHHHPRHAAPRRRAVDGVRPDGRRRAAAVAPQLRREPGGPRAESAGGDRPPALPLPGRAQGGDRSAAASRRRGRHARRRARRARSRRDRAGRRAWPTSSAAARRSRSRRTACSSARAIAARTAARSGGGSERCAPRCGSRCRRTCARRSTRCARAGIRSSRPAIPAHATIVYHDEAQDLALLRVRLAAICRRTAPFAVALGARDAIPRSGARRVPRGDRR